MKKTAALLGLALCLCHCGYHLRGTGSSLPSYIRTVCIPMFKNQTTRFELDRKLTQGVIDELVTRGKVEITEEAEGADALMIGEILNFKATPIGFTGQATADRYSITIVTKITLRDQVNNRIIFSNPNYIYQGEYEVEEGTDFESVETEAIDSIVQEFAQSVVSTILEGF